jgi:hypothetical protein
MYESVKGCVYDFKYYHSDKGNMLTHTMAVHLNVQRRNNWIQFAHPIKSSYSVTKVRSKLFKISYKNSAFITIYKKKTPPKNVILRQGPSAVGEVT